MAGIDPKQLSRFQTQSKGLREALPEPLRALVDALYPEDDPRAGLDPASVLGAPMGMAAGPGLKLVKGAATPAAEMLGAQWSQPGAKYTEKLVESFRPKDLSQVMPEVASQVPSKLDTAGDIGRTFRDYKAAIAGLLGMGNR